MPKKNAPYRSPMYSTEQSRNSPGGDRRPRSYRNLQERKDSHESVRALNEGDEKKMSEIKKRQENRKKGSLGHSTQVTPGKWVTK